MLQGPSLIFDKSSLESLNLDEAVSMDNFYLSNITPLFYVELPCRSPKEDFEQQHAGATCRIACGSHARLTGLSERAPRADFEG